MFLLGQAAVVGNSVVNWAIVIVVIAAVVALVVLALRQFNVAIPAWVVQVFWIVVVALVVIAAILFVGRLVGWA
jgi:hypothetical protein